MKRRILACWLCLSCAWAWAEQPNVALRLLSIAVPNGVAAEVGKTIKAFEAKAGPQ